MSFKNKLENICDKVSGISKDKIKLFVRDKAYKEVLKELVENGKDVTTISQEDLEYLIAEKEKEIYNKYSISALTGMIIAEFSLST